MLKFDQKTNLGLNYNVASTHETPIVWRKRDDRRNDLAKALGADSSLGEGHQDRLLDHQRAF